MDRPWFFLCLVLSCVFVTGTVLGFALELHMTGVVEVTVAFAGFVAGLAIANLFVALWAARVLAGEKAHAARLERAETFR